MAGKFIELKQAAEQLGLSPDRLLEMREGGEIHGYRDGSSWKFKIEEITRVAQELAGGADSSSNGASDSAPLSGDDLSDLLNVPLGEQEDADLESSSILISEGEGGADEESSSSTVIGKEDAGEDEDSDLKLAADSAVDGASGVSLVPDEKAGSDVELVADSSGDDELQLADDEDLSDELKLGDELDFESDDALLLGEDSGFSVGSDEEELHLDGSSGELDIASSDSGINVGAPSDSGLLLEDSADGEMLELPEDEEMVELEGPAASDDDLGDLPQDEEFLLSPSGDLLGDESSDSGSQVIALEDSGAFESDEGMDVGDSAEPVLVPDDAAGLEDQIEFDATAAEQTAVPMGGIGLPEAPYSIWNILALLSVVALLGITGMLMSDIVRNMWAWNGDSSVASGLANSIVDMLGMK